MKQETEKYFAGLTAEQIANERPGKWGDYELLDVWHYFMEEVDRERETAVLELILHSPEHSEMVEYRELYYDLAQNHRLDREYTNYTLTGEILAQGKVLIPELIRLAFSDPGNPGSAQAIALLRRLRDEEAAVFSELSPWLDKADNGWQETLSQSMSKIGGFTTAELKAIAADTDYFTFVRMGATEALRERLDENPELYEEIVAFFRHLLNRPDAYATADEEEFVGFLIGDIEDAEMVIRLAMAEHDFGDRAQAKALYQQVFQLARQDIFSTEMMEIAAAARDGLKALERGDYSPMDMPISASVYYGESENRKSSSLRRSTQMKKPKKR